MWVALQVMISILPASWKFLKAWTRLPSYRRKVSRVAIIRVRYMSAMGP